MCDILSFNLQEGAQLASQIFANLFQRTEQDAVGVIEHLQSDMPALDEDELLQIGFTPKEILELQITELLEIQKKRRS